MYELVPSHARSQHARALDRDTTGDLTTLGKCRKHHSCARARALSTRKSNTRILKMFKKSRVCARARARRAYPYKRENAPISDTHADGPMGAPRRGFAAGWGPPPRSA